MWDREIDTQSAAGNVPDRVGESNFLRTMENSIKKAGRNYRLIGPACELSSKIGDNRQDGGKLPEGTQFMRSRQSFVRIFRLPGIVKYVNSSNLGRM